MQFHHRRIPALPDRPRIHPIAGQIKRSYPVGRQNFSRALQGRTLELTITAEVPFPKGVLIRLETTLNRKKGNPWMEVPFVCDGDRTQVCRLIPERTGLHSFRAKYSLDEGATWVSDSMPDAWVLVDPAQADGPRIYTMIPNVSGSLADWKLEVERIKAMGFNTVHLLPVTVLDVSESPYAAKDLFGIDPGYLIPGSRKDEFAQLTEFVEHAKALEIRLCFDLVLNHVGVCSEMAQHAPDWIVPDQNKPDGFKRARYWSSSGWQNWDDLVLINFEHPSEGIRSEIWDYMTAYALFWAKYADETGGFVRFDNLHSSAVDFVEELSEKLHSEFPELGILAEYFTDERTMLDAVPNWGLNLVLATPWDLKFVPQLREYLNYLHRASEHIRYFMPITSHDSGSPAQEFGAAESTVPRYVAAALLGTGATGIPQGVEFGLLERIDFLGRPRKMEFPAEARFAPLITRVNAILAEHASFRCGENCRFVDGGHPAVIAAFRQQHGRADAGFLVACNFDIVNSQAIAVDLVPLLGSDGLRQCTELLSGEPREFAHSPAEIFLPPCSAQVLMFA